MTPSAIADVLPAVLSTVLVAWVIATAAGRRSAAAARGPAAPDAVFLLALTVLVTLASARALAYPAFADGDTRELVTVVRRARSLSALLAYSRPWAGDYLLQAPGLYALRRSLGVDPMEAFQYASIVGGVVGAFCLRALALRLGATPWNALLAALLPLSTFGTGCLAATLDDNIPAAALEWAFVCAFLHGFTNTPPRRPAAAAAVVGLLLGVAVGFHRKAVLWGAAVVAGPVVVGERHRRAPVARWCAIVGAVGAAVYFALAAALLPAGPRELGRVFVSRHHQEGVWFYFARPGASLGDQAAQALRGLRSSLVLFDYDRARILGTTGLHPLDLVVPAVLALLAASLWITRARPACRVLAASLGVHALHSFFYEPFSIERWDVVLGVVGILASVAISTREAHARWLRPFAWATWLGALVIQQWALTVTMHA